MSYIGDKTLETYMTSISNNPFSFGFTAGASFTAKRIVVHISGTKTSAFKCAIYADDSGSPGALIVVSDESNYNGSAGWFSVGIADTSIVNGTKYHLACWFDDVNVNGPSYAAGNSGTIYKRSVVNYPNWPDPFATDSHNDSVGPISIYADDIMDWKKALTDSQTIAEALVKDSVIPLADSLTIAEGMGNQLSLNLSDSISIAEGLAKVSEYFLSPAEAVSLSEATAKNIIFPLADSLDLAELGSNKPSLIFSDSQSITEALDGSEVGVGLADSIVISESKVIDIDKSLTANVDQIASISGKEIKASLSDSLTMAESLVVRIYKGVILADSLVISESLNKNFIKRKTENFDLFDQIANEFKKPISDSIAFQENPSLGLSLALGDSISISEQSFLSANPNFSESLTFSEEVSKEFLKPISDDISISEFAYFGKFVVLSDSISFAEQLLKNILYSGSDSVILSEALELKNEFQRSVADSITLLEGESKEFYKVLSDLVEFSDIEIEKHILHLEDTVETLDEISARSFVKSISDNQLISDSEGVVLSLPLSDAVEISETFSSERGFILSFSESIDFSDTLKFGVVLSKEESEPISEAVGNSISLSLSDALAINESLVLGVGKIFTESVNLSESSFNSIFVSLNSSLAIADSIFAGGNYLLDINDSLDISEALIKETAKNIADNLDISDAPSGVISRELTDSILITESVAKAIVFYLELSDSVDISEIIGEQDIKRSFDDSLLINEAIIKSSYVSLSDEITINENAVSGEHVYTRIGASSFLRTSDV
jgi:hypothetical protein